MTHVATMGTSSCATIAIGGFKGNNKELNDKYLVDPKSFKAPTDGLSVQQFYSQILYPTTQPLGRSHDLPFTKLMEDIDASSMKTKFMIATLNADQFLQHGGYWPNQLKKWGFTLLTKTKNVIGSVNYIYTKNPNQVEIKDGEA